MRNRVHLSVLGAVSLLLLVAVAAPGSPIAESPVADAAMRGDADTVRALLRDGADVNAAQGDGMTALHWSAINGDAGLTRVLLYAGANADSTTRLGGYTPLHLATNEGRGEVVTVLLEAGSNPAAITDTGLVALHFAAQAGDAKAVLTLLEHGADINIRGETHGRAPLIFAASRNRLEAMEVLIAQGADVYLATKVIDYPARARQDNLARQARQRIVEAAKPPQPGGRGAPPQQGQQQSDPANAPPNDPPDPDTPPVRGGGGAAPADPPDPDTPPAGGAQADPPDPDTTPDRRGGGTDPADIPDPDDPAGTPRTNLSNVSSFRGLSTTDQIGKQGGFAAIHYAAREGYADAALMLLDVGTDIDLLTSGDKSTPMVVAVINGNFDLAMELLERGADPKLLSEDGVGPLFATINIEWHLRTWYPQPTAAEQQDTSYLELMRALLEAGADANERTTSHIWYVAYNAGRMGVDFSGITPLWRAAYATDVKAMRLLVEYGADPNISSLNLRSSRRRGSNRGGQQQEQSEDPSGLPPVPPGGPHVHPLHAASGVGFGTSRVGQQHRHVPDGWLPAVTYLVEELGVDVNVRDADGFSAVHHAAARGDNEMIEFLVEHGADVTFVSRRGQTTVDMANGPQQRVQPFPETIALLESLGAINNHKCRSCD